MLDKFLTGENVKVNGEIAGRLHILSVKPNTIKLLFVASPLNTQH
jgi:hypothetical protein